MKNKFRILFIILIFCQLQIFAQITVTPAQPTDQDTVTVVFDATLGNGGLAGYTGEVYAHTGVITNLSTSQSDWKYVKAGWGVNIPACKLTQIGIDLWQLGIGPDIRQFYGVPAGEQILKLAFVFRSGVQVGGSWLEGKTASGGDIFWDVMPSGLSVGFSLPADNIVITTLGTPVNMVINSSFADTTFLYQDNQLLAFTTLATFSYSTTPLNYGPTLIKAIATNDTGMIADSFYLFVRQPVTTLNPPVGTKEGINYLSDTSVRICLCHR
ncbi:MAG: hypothetical protein NTU44_03625 [Bacteroidetes bacterium]|nr:hypothetical protein [Bacteroidota bacterium]